MKTTINNLSLLPLLSEDSAVDVLEQRYLARKPYTIAQDQVLIAINPQQDWGLNGASAWAAHDAEEATSSSSSSPSPEPHVYSISSRVQKRFSLYATQAVFCCGESGSGKTESAKLILQHFASFGATAAVAASSSSSCASRIVLTSNPVLEAFGNAVTSANANSSRFGKVLTLDFAPQHQHGGDLVAATAASSSYALERCQVKTFLFERSRVCASSQGGSGGERNFHIFYQLMRSRDESWPELAMLTNNNTFRILNRAEDDTVRDDAGDFERTLAGLAAVGVPLEMQRNLVRVLGTILHVGQFTGSSNGHNELAASELLQTDTLGDFFAKRSVTVRGETIWMSNTTEQACHLRDLLCKELYLLAFEYVLSVINQTSSAAVAASSSSSTTTTTTTTNKRTCYLIDIMGFESLDSNKNRLEQLLINYCNEAVYGNLLCYTQIAAIEEEYAREGIDFTPRSGNASISLLLPLFDSPRNGLWRLLESEGQTPGGTDAGFLRKLKHAFPSLVQLAKRQNATTFTVQHYAGRVEYDAEGFLEKSLHNGANAPLHNLLKTSGLVKCFPSRRPTNTSNSNSNNNNKRTIGTVFQKEMTDLVTTLRAVDKISWIRCIRPSATVTGVTAGAVGAVGAAGGAAASFDAAYVKQQLAQSGILSAIHLSRSALPIRLPLANFLAMSVYWSEGVDDAIDAGEEVKFGKTLVYLTDRVYGELHRGKQQHFAAIKLQWRVRVWLARRELQRIGRAAGRIQAWWRRRAWEEEEATPAVLAMEEENSVAVLPLPPTAPLLKVAQLVSVFEESKVIFALAPTPAVSVSAATAAMEARIAELEQMVESRDRELELERKRAQREVKDLDRRVKELQREVVRLRGGAADDVVDENRRQNDDSSSSAAPAKKTKPTTTTKRPQSAAVLSSAAPVGGILGLCLKF